MYDNARSLVVDVAALGDRSLAVLESTLTAAGEQNFSLYRADLDDGKPPSPTLPDALDKKVIELGGGASVDSIGRVGAGPGLDGGYPTLIVAFDVATGEATRIEALAIGPTS